MIYTSFQTCRSQCVRMAKWNCVRTTIKRRGKIIEFPFDEKMWKVNSSLCWINHHQSNRMSSIHAHSVEKTHISQSFNLQIGCFCHVLCTNVFLSMRTTLCGGSAESRERDWDRKKRKKILRKQHATKRQIYYFSRSPASVRECVFVDLNNEFLDGQRFRSSTNLHRRKLIDKNIHTVSSWLCACRGQFRVPIREWQFCVERFAYIQNNNNSLSFGIVELIMEWVALKFAKSFCVSRKIITLILESIFDPIYYGLVEYQQNSTKNRITHFSRRIPMWMENARN